MKDKKLHNQQKFNNMEYNKDCLSKLKVQFQLIKINIKLIQFSKDKRLHSLLIYSQLQLNNNMECLYRMANSQINIDLKP